MTTEELKAVVREYGREHYPSGYRASVMFDYGEGGDHDLIRVNPCPECPPTSPEPSGPSPAR